MKNSSRYLAGGLFSALLLSVAGASSAGNPQPAARAAPTKAITVSVTPSALTLDTGASTAFTCAVTNTKNRTCLWSVQEGAAGGTVSASGAYAAPATAGVYHVVAASQADTTKKAVATVTVKAPVPPQPASGTWVTAYYAGFYWDKPEFQAPQHVDMSAMTHFVYAHVRPGGGSAGGSPGQLIYGSGTAGNKAYGPGAPNLSVEDYLVGGAHAAGIKALLMLGGAGDGGGFAVSTNATYRATFINNVINYLVAHDYDGVDVDWEDTLDTSTQQNQLLAFLSELRTAANANPRYQTKPILITFPGYALNTNYQTVAPWMVQVAARVDQFNLMTYGMAWGDPNSGWSTWHFSPLFGQAPTHPMDINSSTQLYLNAGVPRAKLGIGIGFYGMSYAPPNTGPNQAITGAWDNWDGNWAYASLARLGYLNNGSYTWDDVSKVGYRSYPGGYAPAGRSATGFLSYEDPASVTAKGQWVRANGFGGTIVWLINYGTTDGVNNPMMAAVKNSFLAPPIAPSAK